VKNLMNSHHKAHNEASREGHDRTFGYKCHWHGCRDATGCIDGRPLCGDCYEEHERIRDSCFDKSGSLPSEDVCDV